MFIYPELNELLNEYNKVRTYTFFVYGVPTEEHIEIINRGLYYRVVAGTKIVKERTVLIVETIDEEQANFLGCYQGTKLIFAFAQNDIDGELIQGTILEGLEYLRFKCEFVGTRETEANV
jgi:hypothetical protein